MPHRSTAQQPRQTARDIINHPVRDGSNDFVVGIPVPPASDATTSRRSTRTTPSVGANPPRVKAQNSQNSLARLLALVIAASGGGALVCYLIMRSSDAESVAAPPPAGAGASARPEGQNATPPTDKGPAPSYSLAQTKQLIWATIETGAPLYNAGDYCGCLTAYLGTRDRFLAVTTSVPEQVRTRLERVAGVGLADGSCGDGAGAVRSAFDDVLAMDEDTGPPVLRVVGTPPNGGGRATSPAIARSPNVVISTTTRAPPSAVVQERGPAATSATPVTLAAAESLK